MQSFISRLVQELLLQKINLAQTTIVLPTIRAGVFLKKELKLQYKSPTLFPKIISIENFIHEVSGFQKLDSLSLIFESYQVYSNTPMAVDKVDFATFLSWASTLINDFNEIDHQNVNGAELYNHLADIKRIEHWDINPNNNTLSLQYLKLFESFNTLYTQFSKHLVHSKKGYSGLMAKEALSQIDNYLQHHANQFIFAGFNALTKVEELILEQMIQVKRAQLFWDIDQFHFNHPTSAAFYISKYTQNNKLSNNSSFNWVFNQLDTPKTIQAIAVPKLIGQCKTAAQLLEEIPLEDIKNTALILGDESLLPVVLNSIPKSIKQINITMGFGLTNMPISSLFDNLFRLHLNQQKNSNQAFYYKDILGVLNHASLNFNTDVTTLTEHLKQDIYKGKQLFFSISNILTKLRLDQNKTNLISLIFSEIKEPLDNVINRFIKIINLLNHPQLNRFEQECLSRLENVFNQLLHYNQIYNQIEDLNTLYVIFKQVLKQEQLDFRGEPLQGLQIMGLLESRVLDFKHVILISANEGVIPAGQQSKSFIPNDIKKHYNLPGAKEKDAVYSYHFYKLLHRAQTAHLIFNSEKDQFGSGEQSRFITELDVFNQQNVFQHISFSQKHIVPGLKISNSTLQQVEKTNEVMERLFLLLQNGLSPSSINTYIRNPIQFYERKILKIKEYQDVEETVAANTFGTIIHESLKELYTPLINQFLTEKHLADMRTLLEDVLLKQFKLYYSLHSLKSGKNYLTFEVAKQYLLNFLNFEVKTLKKGVKIKILGLEQDISVPYRIDGHNHQIILKGQIDRIDEVDGTLRILDYKTGKVEKKDLTLSQLQSLKEDAKYDKCLQVLLYTYMYAKHAKLEPNQILSGIISFKNLSSGFLSFKDNTKNPPFWTHFKSLFDDLLLELLDSNKPFIEKEHKTYD